MNFLPMVILPNLMMAASSRFWHDSIDFLQSILTANVATVAVGDCRPAALLTPQGRILIDMMIYRSV